MGEALGLLAVVVVDRIEVVDLQVGAGIGADFGFGFGFDFDCVLLLLLEEELVWDMPSVWE